MSDPALATTAAHLVQSDQAPPALIPGDQVPGEGQLVDPAGDVETRAAALLTKSTQEILMLLASGMTEENAPQLLMKVQALAQTQRQLLPYFGGYLQPEHDPRRKQRGMAKASRKRHVSAESHAARTIQELMAVAGKLQAEWTLPQTIRAVKAARDAGMEDVAKELEARVRAGLGDRVAFFWNRGEQRPEVGRPDVVRVEPQSRPRGVPPAITHSARYKRSLKERGPKHHRPTDAYR